MQPVLVHVDLLNMAKDVGHKQVTIVKQENS